MLKRQTQNILCIMICVMFNFFSFESKAQLAVWTDSLAVRIVDSAIVGNRLEFSIELERVNPIWNNSDVNMGTMDLYMNFNPNAFVGQPQFVSINPNLYLSSINTLAGGSSNPSALLQIEVRTFVGRLLISTTKRFELQAGSADYAQVSATPVNLGLLSVGVPVELCRVSWELNTSPMEAALGIKWDLPSVGLKTRGGNPILDVLEGDIDKNPSPVINIDTLPAISYVCEKDDLILGTHAESSGDSLRLKWYSSTDNSSWTPITQDDVYTFNNTSLPDTMTIRGVTDDMDNLYIRAEASDPTLATPAVSTTTRLIVRDSIRGFLNILSNSASFTATTVSPNIKICNNTSAEFSFYAAMDATQAEFLTDHDSIFFRYIVEEASGNLREDTLKVNTSSADRVSTSGGTTYFAWSASFDVAGTYYLKNIWTNNCANAKVLNSYDTVHLRKGEYVELPRMTVEVNSTIVTDTALNPYGIRLPDITSVVASGGLNGSVNYSGLPFRYTASSEVGTDTLLYNWNTSNEALANRCPYTRLIDVVETKYLSLKIFLEGPFISSKTKMRPIFTFAHINPSSPASSDYLTAGSGNTVIPEDVSGLYFISPYGFNSNPPDSVRTDKLRNIARDLETATGDSIVDWVQIVLRDVGNHDEQAVSAFVRNDGVVMSMEGEPYLKFTNLSKGNYYVIVDHRNHLAVRSNNLVALRSTPPATDAIMADFTNNASANYVAAYSLFSYRPVYVYGTGNIITLIPYDVQKNGTVTISDRVEILKNLGMKGYSLYDINFNGVVDQTDLDRFNSFRNDQQGF